MIDTITSTSTLAARLRERIRSDGPIPFHQWMKAALYDPVDGYYCRSVGQKWGREGDYRTSPERSRLFSATFARYFAGLYETLGRPAHWTIIEVGAGDGRFARGVLETLQHFFPVCYAATSYVIDEFSPRSREKAQELLDSAGASPRASRPGERVAFTSLKDTKIESGIVFSNELLDAFPVHRVIWQGGAFREFCVDSDGRESFEWVLRDPSSELASRLDSYFQDHGLQLSEGQIVEVNFAVDDYLRLVAERLRNGYLITVDYGASAADLHSEDALGGTLRGFLRHEFVADLLADPGEHDLTTTVNWSQVKKVGARVGLEVLEFKRQDTFLLAAGFLDQLALDLIRCEDEAQRLRLTTEAREMILPDGMAARFQVLVQRKTTAPVAANEEADEQ
jgi:SAM-dependent MidA family methyltransferase